MDFLDPRRRRAHHIRLMVGYVLVAIAIGLATVVLVYSTNGYGIDTKTGKVIQNGLLFVNSRPGGAEIYLNGQDHQATTSARLIIPAGDYTLTLKKPGYRDWQRAFTLEASSIDRFVYPFLFPTSPRVTAITSYSSLPSLITQSPDQRWLLVQNPKDSSGLSFDVYDTTNLTQAPEPASIPAGVLSPSKDPKNKVSVVEWSNDNKNVLLKHSFNGGSEFVVFNRDSPVKSFNVNKTFGVNPSQVALFNKKVSQLYVYDAKAKTVQLGTVSSGALASPTLSHVLAFKPYGTSLISYVTDQNMPSGQVQARIWSSGSTYPLYSFLAGNDYLIDIAQYGGHWYYFAGSNTEKRVNIYEDPLNDLQNPSIRKATPTLALNVAGATKASFSSNAEFIEAENGQSFGVYDIGTQQVYQYRLKSKVDAPLSWMDGNRLIGESAGEVLVTDYDSTNQQILTSTLYDQGGLFSKDYNHLLTFQAGKKGIVNLVDVDMRAGADLPAQ